MSSIAAFDMAVVQGVAAWQTAWLDAVMLLVTHLGNAGFIWLVLAGLAAVFPATRPAAWRVVFAIALASLVVDGMAKPLIWRNRPFAVSQDVRVIDAKPVTSSFPSGHAARAIAGAVAVSQLLPAGQVAWWALAGAIAFSRIYVGVHFPTDVLAGALLGLLCAKLALGRLSAASPEPEVS